VNLLAADHPEIADSLDTRSRALMALQRYAEARADAEAALRDPPGQAAGGRTERRAQPGPRGLAEYALQHAGTRRTNWDRRWSARRAPGLTAAGIGGRSRRDRRPRMPHCDRSRTQTKPVATPMRGCSRMSDGFG
jgi:hypothetical protein